MTVRELKEALEALDVAGHSGREVVVWENLDGENFEAVVKSVEVRESERGDSNGPSVIFILPYVS